MSGKAVSGAVHDSEFPFYASLLYEVLLYVLRFLELFITMESRQQTVELPGRMGYVRCSESRRLRALEMLGHVLFGHYVGIAAVKSIGNVWSCIVCSLFWNRSG
ncbi:hypothetical protein FPQ18DRAFT_337743 [Pyronema domesticum]|nr:hypothetical protein FPQ18DRAFT_337743 [Pyronema domesticum]